MKGKINNVDGGKNEEFSFWDYVKYTIAQNNHLCIQNGMCKNTQKEIHKMERSQKHKYTREKIHILCISFYVLLHIPYQIHN